MRERERALDFFADHKKTFLKLIRSEKLVLAETRFLIGICVSGKKISQSDNSYSVGLETRRTQEFEE